jgi:hypothetical protein
MMPPKSDSTAAARESPLSTDSRYTSLDPAKEQFRLLNLLPGERGSDIECEIFPDNLRDPQPFGAFSYTWGDAISGMGRIRYRDGGGFPQR